MKMNHIKKQRKLSIILVLAVIVSCFAGVGNANKAEAAITSSGIIYNGNGSTSKNLLNGKVANVDVVNSVISIMVDGEKYGYYDQVTVGTCEISEDDLLHIFWHTGDYFVYDLYENASYIVAYKSVSTQEYCAQECSDAYAVMGTSAPNSSFHSCIIDEKYFYQYGKAGKKRLMTREEFEKIAYGKEPTATPTVEPTQEPTPTPTVEPTQEPTVTPTVEPTQVPTSMPTVEPTQKPGNGSLTEGGNANASDSNANGGNAQEGIVDNDINGDGNTTNTSIDQDITINNTVTNVTVNGNNNSVGTSVGTAANALPIKPATVSTKTKSKTVKPKTYYGAIQSGFRLKLYKVTQKVTNGKIKTVRQWKSICLFDKKKERMDWNAFKLKKVKKCQFSNKKHWIVIIKKNGKVYACPSGKGTKKVKYIGKGAVAFKCNSRGLATSYVKKSGKVVKLKY